MDEMDNVLGLELALDAQYIDQLEAENKRLRDALVSINQYCASQSTGTGVVENEVIRMTQEALKGGE